MKSGQITINGINDKELIAILQVKERYEGSVQFQPNMLQPGQPQPQRPGQATQPYAGKQLYNNVILGFGDEKGLQGIREILNTLTEAQP